MAHDIARCLCPQQHQAVYGSKPPPAQPAGMHCNTFVTAQARVCRVSVLCVFLALQDTSCYMVGPCTTVTALCALLAWQHVASQWHGHRLRACVQIHGVSSMTRHLGPAVTLHPFPGGAPAVLATPPPVAVCADFSSVAKLLSVVDQQSAC